VLLFSSPLVCFAVASLGIVKGKDKTNPDTPGLVDLVKGLLDILPAQGSKALHDEIKVMLKVSPFRLVEIFCVTKCVRRRPKQTNPDAQVE